MISPRYHLVSLAAVFLALAVGVLLGASAPADRLLGGLAQDRDDLGRQVADLQGQRAALREQLAGTDAFDRTVGVVAARDQLSGRKVVLVTTADADPADRDALRSLLGTAGASVSAELQLTDAFTDPSRADALRDVVTRVLPAGAQLPTASDPGTLAGGLLGTLLLTGPDGVARAGATETTAALGALVGGGFVRTAADPATLRPGTLAVVLAGAALTGDSAGDRAAVLARLATVLDAAGGGAVLAGRTGSAAGSGPVGVVRADTAATAGLSTVDDVDTAAGRVTTVLALREQADGRAGRYGTAANAQAAAPQPAGAG
jgi:hypothetical protein